MSPGATPSRLVPELLRDHPSEEGIYAAARETIDEVLKYTLGTGGPQSSNQQSVDLTATLLKYPGGKFLVIVIGLALIGGGSYLAYEAWKEKFRRDMELGQMRARTRRIVE